MNARKLIESINQNEKQTIQKEKIKEKLYSEYMENQAFLRAKRVDSKRFQIPHRSRRAYFLPPGQNWDKQTRKRIETQEGFIDFCKNQTEKEKRKWEKRKEKEKRGEKEKEEPEGEEGKSFSE